MKQVLTSNFGKINRVVDSVVIYWWIFQLQEGLTAEEISKSEPDEPQHMQVTFCPNNLMLSINSCKYYLLTVSFCACETDDGCSLQTLLRAYSGSEGCYPCRTCWPIYGLHLNVLLIFKFWNYSPALFMTRVWLLPLFSWNAPLVVIPGLPLVMRCLCWH
jgi:hypothetical protein